MSTKTIRAKVLRDFRDAGAERQFTADETVELTTGEFENLRVCGLVEAAVEEPAAPVDAGDGATKAGRTR